MKREYSVGDVCWIRLAPDSALIQGEVVQWFEIHTQPNKFYIIQLDTPEITELIIRDATLMAERADTALPIEGTMPVEKYRTAGLQ